MFVCLAFVEIFLPLAAKIIGPRTGRQFFKKMSILPTTCPLKKLQKILFLFLIMNF